MNTKNTNIVEFPRNSKNAVDAIERILEYAAASCCSDIHIDPRVSDVLVRARINGTIEDIGVLPKPGISEVISRLKILSGARTDLHAVPQDGRFKMDISGVSYNIRASFMPTYHGENAVLRLLPVTASTDVSFAKLGFTPDIVRLFDDSLKKTHGLILVTGPTGSGKTTTLHTCLSLKARQPLSIVTLEDPVEYEVPGVRQIHLRQAQGFSFAAGLRATLRQDPDVIMVGEIRDAETARVAIHTALTGHLVLSTLHTNSALEAISRLMDMGIDHYLLASTLRMVVGQRLVRAICDTCHLAGCENCRGSGYDGRLVIAEAYEVDAEMKDLILRKASISEMTAHVRSKGFCSMAEDGSEKVDWGVTAHEEVLRVLHE